LLKGATGLGAATTFAAAETGCAHSPAASPASASGSEPPLPSAEEIAKVVREMDERLAWIDRHDARDKLFGGTHAGSSADLVEREQKTKLFRQAMRTLYVTGRFMDLPDEVKMHPDLQSRLWNAQPDMDEAVLGMTEVLESLRPEDHAAIQSTLRAQPDLMEGLASIMDATAKEDGLPVRRRAAVRTTTLSLADRMAKQAPNLVVDPYVRRVRRLQARPIPTTGAARAMAARLGEDAYWQQEQRLTDLAMRWQRHLAQTTTVAPATQAGSAHAAAPASGPAAAPVVVPAAAPSADPSADPAATPAPRKPGESTIRVGGYMMGFGAGSIALGLIFAGLNSAFQADALLAGALIFGVTIGPILLIAGLIVLIVGQIIKASSSPK